MEQRKVALVTGAAQGLGAGLVEALQARGYVVYAAAHRAPSSSSSSSSSSTSSSASSSTAPNEDVIPLALDVASDAEIHAAAAVIRARHGRLDLLFNNAALNKDSAAAAEGPAGHKAHVSRLGELRREALVRMFDVNAVAPLLVAAAVLPLMTAPACCIVNVSSSRASFHDEFPNSDGNYGYRGSKAALNMLTHCLCRDLPANVRTFAVHPGPVRSCMNPAGTLSPREAADHIIALATDAWDPAYHGRFLRFDGTFYPL